MSNLSHPFLTPVIDSEKELEEHIELTLSYFEVWKLAFKYFYIRKTNLPLRRLSVKKIVISSQKLFEKQLISQSMNEDILLVLQNIDLIRKKTIASLNKAEMDEFASIIGQTRMLMRSLIDKMENLCEKIN